MLQVKIIKSNQMKHFNRMMNKLGAITPLTFHNHM